MRLNRVIKILSSEVIKFILFAFISFWFLFLIFHIQNSNEEPILILFFFSILSLGVSNIILVIFYAFLSSGLSILIKTIIKLVFFFLTIQLLFYLLEFEFLPGILLSIKMFGGGFISICIFEKLINSEL